MRGMPKNATGVETPCYSRAPMVGGWTNAENANGSPLTISASTRSLEREEKSIREVISSGQSSISFLSPSAHSHPHLHSQQQLQLFQANPPNNQHAFHSDPGSPDHLLQLLLRCHVNDNRGAPGSSGRLALSRLLPAHRPRRGRESASLTSLSHQPQP